MPMTDNAPTPHAAPLPIAVLLSGSGRTLDNLATRIEDGRLNAKISLVVASASGIAGIERAEQHGLPLKVIPQRMHPDRLEYATEIFDAVRQSGARLVCLAGFLWRLAIPGDYENRVLNIHPALLPSFGGKGMYGRRVHQAVLDAGCKVSGCTVHFADDHYDTGPILVQKCLAVNETDDAASLADRVFELECEAYPAAINLVAEDRVRVEGGRCRVFSQAGASS